MVPIGSFVLLLLLLAPLSLRADPITGRPDARPARLRTTDPRLQSMIRDGIRHSKTFQALVRDLDDSDVVVYIEEDRDPRRGIDGRLTLVSAAGGIRYVMVRVIYLADPTREIAILGHELQHAVEVAAAPEVVDNASLAREYTRIGTETRLPSIAGRAFDTGDAVRAGYRVLHEMRAGNAD